MTDIALAEAWQAYIGVLRRYNVAEALEAIEAFKRQEKADKAQKAKEEADAKPA